eukprot:350494-Chlamydomonas_euryale.AAC.8
MASKMSPESLENVPTDMPCSTSNPSKPNLLPWPTFRCKRSDTNMCEHIFACQTHKAETSVQSRYKIHPHVIHSTSQAPQYTASNYGLMLLAIVSL